MNYRALTIIALQLLSVSALARERTNRYVVTIGDDAKVARVEAQLWLPSPTLAMFGVIPTATLPNGQADLLRDLAVTTAAGEKVAVKNLGEGDYELSAAGDVQIGYTVLLEHDQHHWGPGLEEVAYRTAEGLMLTGSALFLAPGDRTDTPIEVEFRLPRGWQAMTPWKPAGAMRFSPASRRELVVNAMFLGTAPAETVNVGGVDLTLVLGACCRGEIELFVELLRQQLHSYVALFGAPPHFNRYLIIINAGDTADGGAFTNSFSQFIRGKADPHNRVIWGHVMAHELLHFWNGLSLIPEDPREEWFKEGATDYLTIVTQSRNGMLDDAALRNRLENINRRYVLARKLQGLGMSVRAAGENKQQNRLLVYAGGSLAAFALDVEIRKATANRKGLDDVMKSLFASHASAKKPYGFEDVVRAASSVAGRDLRPLLTRAVDTETDFDIEPAFRDVGLRLDQFYEEQFLRPDSAATAGERDRYRAIFGRNLTD